MKKDHGLGSAKRSPYRWARKPKLSLGDLSLQFEQVRSDCSAHQMHQWNVQRARQPKLKGLNSQIASILFQR